MKAEVTEVKKSGGFLHHVEQQLCKFILEDDRISIRALYTTGTAKFALSFIS